MSQWCLVMSDSDFSFSFMSHDPCHLEVKENIHNFLSFAKNLRNGFMSFHKSRNDLLNSNIEHHF